MYVEKFPKILEDNPEAREIKPRSENYNPNLVSALTGHVEGSRVFTRYRTIDMKKDLVKMLEGKQWGYFLFDWHLTERGFEKLNIW